VIANTPTTTSSELR